MAQTPHIAGTSPTDWKYISEGGSTIVFSYTGPPHPQFDGTALRLRKNVLASELEPMEDEENEKEQDDPTIVFQRAVIERLVPKEYLPRLEAVRVQSAWLAELAAICEERRPIERRGKDRIDVHKRKAVLAADLVGGKGWAVEIKPKWGFLPSSLHLSPRTLPIKTRTCRFCMHAHLKTTQGEDVSLGYCPLDLFSGEEARVTRALHALWDVWIGSSGGVNNLRVFVDGQMLRPTVNPSSLSPLAHKLLSSLPVSPSMPSPAPTLNELRECLTSALLPLLLEVPVVPKLAVLQRRLDALDIEGLTALWKRVRPTAGKLGAGLEELTPEDWVRFVDAYLERSENPDSDALPETEEELWYRCAAYLLSATFKDCSIILRMPPPTEDVPTSNGTITVIDLDVKSISRLAKWAELDSEIVDAYAGIRPKGLVRC
ncbi:Inositol-pentakisphosphate 2-kinase [Grifola frondosa]|uniref:Inositol-pentakisphosphate 2-kinase n=1 Tax=Grifola frondosa TaxID=5627 RepID=A0A1C7LNV4_GRIFR|nr:Inositol-pentakisphosphate 2-kinase [Grifola frondosa]